MKIKADHPKSKEHFTVHFTEGSNYFLPFCLEMAFPYIKYTCGISTSKFGPLREPLVKLVTADPYGQVMNDLAAC